MLPRVLAGSSVGSIVASIVATRTDEELRETFAKLESFDIGFFNNSRAVELVHHFLARGALHDMAYLQRKLRQLVGGYTFLEAYERTGRILNVSVCPADTNEPARLLNYLTAPHALVWSAVAASSAFPGLFAPQDILARNARGEEVPFNSLAGAYGGGSASAAHLAGAAGAAGGSAAAGGGGDAARRWRDGSLELDLPTFLLAEQFNCNHFVVSQCNPHIVPLLNLKRALGRKWADVFELELRHRCLQSQALLADLVPTKWLTLFTQPWEGDVTVVLPAALWNVGKSITNPTPEDLVRATKLGELHVWEKLSAIEANCAVEATLDACLARLANKARARPLSGLAARIPSWLCMGPGGPGGGVGPQVVASWGNPLDRGGDGDGGGGGGDGSGGNGGGSSGVAWGPWGPGGWRRTGSSAAVLDAAGAAAAAAAVAAPASAASVRACGPPPAGSPEAMAAAAAAAMAGHARVRYHHPPPGQPLAALSSGAGAGGGLLGATHYPASHHAVLPLHHQHEALAGDARVPRVQSWGSDAIADSVADFPADAAAAAAAFGGGGGAGGHHHHLHPHHHHHHLPRAAAAGGCAAGSPGGAVAAFALSGGSSEAATPRSGAADGLASGSGSASASMRASLAGSGGSGGLDPAVAARLDCCDPTASLDLWGGLLPLSSASAALEAAAEAGQALDVIAP